MVELNKPVSSLAGKAKVLRPGPLAHWNTLAPELAKRGASHLLERQSWVNKALGMGLPNRQHEDWKYASTAHLAATETSEVTWAASAPLSQASTEVRARVAELRVAGMELLVFRNGQWDSELSQLSSVKFSQGEGASTLRSLSQVSELLEQVGGARDYFECLSLATSQNWFVLEVRGKPNESSPVLPVRLQILSLWDSASGGAAAPPTANSNWIGSQRWFLHVGAGAEVEVLETHSAIAVSSDKASGATPVSTDWWNSSVDCLVEKGSKLHWARVSLPNSNTTTHIGRNRIWLQSQSELHSFSYAGGAKLQRHNLDVYLMGEGARAVVDGLTLAGESQVIDHHTMIDHVVGACETKQLYKGILQGTGRAVFDGRVKIRRDAQKASSEQLNQNLLLSRSCEIDTKPQLEIDADDVKATHGSTVGRLREEELFYLRTRGISLEAATEMLSLGFAREVCDRWPGAELRPWLQKLVESEYRKQVEK